MEMRACFRVMINCGSASFLKVSFHSRAQQLPVCLANASFILRTLEVDIRSKARLT